MSRNTHKIVSVEPICVECGKRGLIASGKTAYPDQPLKHGKIYFVCPCGAMVGCHPGTGIPAGRPASGETRYLRAIAHKAFDAIWSNNGTRTRLASGHARTRAYKWLARQLGIEPHACHFGFMGRDELKRALDIIQAKQEAA